MPPTSPPPFPPHSNLDDLLAADTPTGHATSTASSSHVLGPGATASSSTLDRISGPRPPAAAADDIEMGSITPGHRRRRSSILNPIVAPTRTRARSLSQAIPLQDEAKIVEEGSVSSPGADGGRGGSRATTDYSEESMSDEDLHDDEETGLTHKERDRRRRAKRRNMLLDQRVAPEKLTLEEKDEADQSVMKSLLINAGLISLWYIFSLSISLVSSPDTLASQPPIRFPRGRLGNCSTRSASLCADAPMLCSTISGCLTARASTSPSPCSRPRRT